MHPKESFEKFSSYMNNCKNDVSISKEDTDMLILLADLVIGMTSIVLVKAFIIRKLVISLQPNQVGFDFLFLTRAGYLTAVTNSKSLESELLRIWESPETFRTGSSTEGFKTDGLATKRVLDLIFQHLNINP